MLLARFPLLHLSRALASQRASTEFRRRHLFRRCAVAVVDDVAVRLGCRRLDWGRLRQLSVLLRVGLELQLGGELEQRSAVLPDVRVKTNGFLKNCLYNSLELEGHWCAG